MPYSTIQKYDAVIVGGGPSALAEAIRFAGTGQRVAVVSEDFGGCMSIMGDQPLQSYLPELTIAGAPLELHDYMASPVATNPTGYEYTRYIRACFEAITLEKHKLRVVGIEHQGEYWLIHTDCNLTLKSDVITLATGLRPRAPDSRIPGALWTTCFSVYRDLTAGALDRFVGKTIAIVGSGNTAFQLALALVRVARSIAIFASHYPGFYPTDSADRFALRAPSLPAVELIAKSANRSNSRGPINTDHAWGPVSLHIYDELSHNPVMKTIEIGVPERLNRHPLLAASLDGCLKRKQFISTENDYRWISPVAETVLISAIGVTANLPKLHGVDLVDPATGFVRHSDGRTQMPGFYVAGGAAGYISVNKMAPTANHALLATPQFGFPAS